MQKVSRSLTARKVQSGCLAASFTRAGWKRRHATHHGTKKSTTVRRSALMACVKASRVLTCRKLLGAGPSYLHDSPGLVQDAEEVWSRSYS